MKSALVPWSELAARDASDAAVLEAQLAVPYALCRSRRLRPVARALPGRDRRVRARERQPRRVDRGDPRRHAARRADRAAIPGDEMGWFWNITELPELQDASARGHLAQVLAHARVPGSVQELPRPAVSSSATCSNGAKASRVCATCSPTAGQAFAERLPQVREQASAAEPGRLRAAVRSAARRSWSASSASADAAAFATPASANCRRRLDRVARDARARGQRSRSRPRRASATGASAGALLWQQNDQFAVRLWNAKKGMQELQRNLAQASSATPRSRGAARRTRAAGRSSPAASMRWRRASRR